MNKAKSLGCQEIVMHRDGFMTEAGSSNVFYFDSSGSVRTSSLSENILPGITRSILIEALKGTPYSVKEGSCAVLDFNESQKLTFTSGGRSGAQISRDAESREEILNIRDADFAIAVNSHDGTLWILPIEILSIIKKKGVIVC